MARWTHIIPDHRIKNTAQSVKLKELKITHGDEIHVNIMLPYNHNAFKTKSTSNTVEETTIFGDQYKLSHKRK